jgi:glutathione-independent formaldehyde dehydrogenase
MPKLPRTEYRRLPDLNDRRPGGMDMSTWADGSEAAVGFEAKGHDGKEQAAVVLNQAMEVTRAAGSIGIPGLYVTEDPGSHDKQAAKGALSLRFGLGWSKSHSFHTGQTPTLRYNRQLMQAIWHGRLPIADIVNAQVISLEDAPKGYADFDKGAAVKFVLDPHGMVSKAA